ncbi:nucleotidyltransferase family protein [Paenibacillaceae sp. P-4]|uniref:nucleotidyltransferase family protein n=1 Tax=Paenibacillaceae bacterium P-4 TaxID=3160969 RepID=UPI0032E81197
MLEQQLKQYLREHEAFMRDLRIVQELQLPQCYIAAGYIRNYVWDKLHGFDNRSRHSDIDVVYFDRDDVSEERDLRLERALIQQTGNEKWSVKNQARMHTHNGVEPYTSTWDALYHWPETATAVGARLDEHDQLDICAPYGLEDLFQLAVRRCPQFPNHSYYVERVKRKNWKDQWTLLTIIE